MYVNGEEVTYTETAQTGLAALRRVREGWCGWSPQAPGLRTFSVSHTETWTIKVEEQQTSSQGRDQMDTWGQFLPQVTLTPLSENQLWDVMCLQKANDFLGGGL
jgi:hypothetical protein